MCAGPFRRELPDYLDLPVGVGRIGDPRRSREGLDQFPAMPLRDHVLERVWKQQVEAKRELDNDS